MLSGPASAQQRKQKTPRAIALVEWPAKGKPVVVPIAILIDGQFCDAGIYKADPVPMALEDGTVYEVEKSGSPVGFVTIDGDLDANGKWTALAKFQTTEEIAAASKQKSEPPVRREKEEGPPRLTYGKPGQQAQSASTAAPAKQEPAGGDNNGPPRLTKDKPEEQPQTASTQKTPDDSGRPRLTRPADEKNPPAQAASENAPSADNREDQTYKFGEPPRLRRGKPADVSSESAPAPMGAEMSTASTGPHGANQPGAPVKIMAAISDAGGPEPRSYTMPGSELPRQQMMSGMETLARNALQKYADSHGGAHVGELENVEVRAFDLALSNQATVVITASAHPAAVAARSTKREARRQSTPPPSVDESLTYWVTVVARENFNGDLRPLRAWTTDNRHLDAYPRMELIDAVDADGDGRGELLFRAINDQGRSFVIARAGVDTVDSIYDSGALWQ